MMGASRSSYPYCLLLTEPLMRSATATLSRMSSVSVCVCVGGGGRKSMRKLSAW